jgi:hypothetical protein
MRPVKTLTRAAGIGFCAVLFAGSALADPGNGNGNGNGGTPPGQEKKAEQPAPAPAPAPAATPAPPARVAAPGQAKKAEKAAAKAAVKQEQKAAAKAAVKQEQKAAAKAAVKQEQKAAAKAAVRHEHPAALKVAAKVAAKTAVKSEPKATQSKGRSAEAHHHVIICHRTGSASNPYVVINIPWTAWSEAHSPDTGAHPDRDGRHDIMLKDPASRPGSKDGFSKNGCEAGAPAAAVQPVQTTQPAPVLPIDVCPNIEGMQTAVPAGLVKDASGSCVAAPAPAAAVVASTPAADRSASQTKAPTGEVPAAAKPAATEQPASGVLGAVASAPESIAQTATGETLPFTGIPLWIAALLGASLLATGVALRRAAQH